MPTTSPTNDHHCCPHQPNAVSVACLVLMDQQGAVLTTRRPEGKQLGDLWEFPGGKVGARESPEQALRREILEELEPPFLRWSQGHLDVEIAIDARVSEAVELARLTFDPETGEPRLSLP